jgi:transcriptional regulator with XRE-family HTH domain
LRAGLSRCTVDCQRADVLVKTYLTADTVYRIFRKMDIAKIIIEQRGEQNLSQRALAQKAGIRQATLSSIESGGDVKLATARNVLLALGLVLDVVPVPVSPREAKNSSATERASEIKRVREHVKKRRSELQSLLGELSTSQIRHVRQINQKTNTGYLAELWNDFLQLDHTAMQKALGADRFKGMAWQSLLQANPFIVARLGSWT